MYINNLITGTMTLGQGGSTSASHPETRFTLEGGTVETYNITGTLDQQWMVNNGYYVPYNDETEEGGYWIKTITQTDIGNTVTTIGDDVFSGCSEMTSVTISNGVTTIGDNAFYSCYCLTSVIIPDSMSSIGENAFNGCSGLTSMTIPNSVTSIGSDAFSGCSGLTSVTIGNGVTSIGAYAFDGCSGLTSVTIGSGIQRIGEYAFEPNGNPITLTIGKTVAEVQAMGTTDYDSSTNVPYSEWNLPSGSTIVCTNGTITI